MEKEIGWLLQEKYPEINPADLHGTGSGKMVAAAKKDIERIKAGEPLDHVIGFTDFLGCKILVDGSVLIPRPETELIAEKGIDELKVQSSKLKVLDMFAGSGCIGISIVRHIKNAEVVFAEFEMPAIKQIEKNCKFNKIPKNRYEIIPSDIFSNITGTFDYIFANPPYIPLDKKAGLQKSVLDYEPHAALFGGEDGLVYITKFLAEAQKFLNSGGKMYMEFDTPQKPAIEKLLKKYGYKTWQFNKDQYGQWRWITITM